MQLMPVLFCINRAVRETWIRAKYVQRSFVRQLPTADSPPTALHRGTTKRWSVRKLPKRATVQDSGDNNTRKNSVGLSLEVLKQEERASGSNTDIVSTDSAQSGRSCCVAPQTCQACSNIYVIIKYFFILTLKK